MDVRLKQRNVSPGLFSDPELASLPARDKLLFVGLWCMADRDGILEDKPAQVRALVFPYDSTSIETPLESLARLGVILRYEVEGRKCIWIRNFAEYQRPHPKERSYGLPTPPGISVERRVERGKRKEEPNSDSTTPRSRKPSRDEADFARLNVDENRLGVEDINTILGRKLGYRLDTLSFFERLRSVGTPREEWVAVLEAYRDGSTPTAKWAKEAGANTLAFVLRPGNDKGDGFHRILRELEAGSVMPDSAPEWLPPERRRLRDVIKADIERAREGGQSNG